MTDHLLDLAGFDKFAVHLAQKTDVTARQHPLDFADILAEVHFHHHDPVVTGGFFAQKIFRDRPEGFQHQQRNRCPGVPQGFDSCFGGPGRYAVGDDQGFGLR